MSWYSGWFLCTWPEFGQVQSWITWISHFFFFFKKSSSNLRGTYIKRNICNQTVNNQINWVILEKMHINWCMLTQSDTFRRKIITGWNMIFFTLFSWYFFILYNSNQYIWVHYVLYLTFFYICFNSFLVNSWFLVNKLRFLDILAFSLEKCTQKLNE